MGLVKNLRVLFGSDAGKRLIDLENRVSDVEFAQDRIADVSERRFRSLRKRQKDEEQLTIPEGPAPLTAVDRASRRLQLRRMAITARRENGGE